MKRMVCNLLFCTLIISNLNGQVNDDTFTMPDKLYDIHIPLIVTLCDDVDGTVSTSPKKVTIDKGNTFFLLGTTDDGSAIVQFWFTNDKKFMNEVVLKKPDIYKERNTYIIKRKDFENRTRRRYSTALFNKYYPFSGLSVTGGVTLLPIKVRPRVMINNEEYGFDFSKDIQLGISGGLKYRMSHYQPFFINLLLNVGISSVTMDSYNTLGSLSESTDIAALTFAYGVVLDFNKIQFGAFLGRDFVSDKNRNNWIYHGQTWFCLGFGYSIFSVSTKPIGSSI